MWFGGGVVVGLQVCGVVDDCKFPLVKFDGIRVCCVGHVFCYGFAVW